MRAAEKDAEPETANLPTLIDVLRWRACEQPDRCTYTFLTDGEAAEAGISNAELDARARAIASALCGRRLQGERALLLYPPGLELIAALYGCVFAGTVAVLAYPPDPARLDRTLPRLQSIVADAEPAALLTTSDIAELSGLAFKGAPELEKLPRVVTDDVDPALSATWRDPGVGPGDLALLQYTSGSTAEPRGVMLTHAGLLDNIRHIESAFGLSPDSHMALWLPPYHDMGLVGGILTSLYTASTVTLMPPAAFLQRPARWLQAISRSRATICGGPNFAYELCARKVAPEELEGVDLGTLRVAFNGAETVRPETLRRFADAFRHRGFRSEAFFPCYGLAETGLLVSGGLLPAASYRRHVAVLKAGGRTGTGTTATGNLVSCGPPIGGHRVIAVDPRRRTPCAAGETGEIWIAGPSVAAGYYQRPRENARTFEARLADGEGPFLRTGDLGFLRDGELYITSRIKDLIIIRGRNILPQDVERTAESSHPELRPGAGAAFGADVDGAEHLVVVQELRDNGAVPPAEAAAAVRTAVAAAHEVQPYAVVLIEARSLPKTSSGKVQRGRTRQAFLTGALPVLAELRGAAVPGSAQVLAAPEPEPRPAPEPGNGRPPLSRQEIEDLLVAEVAGWLGVEPTEIGIEEPFIDHGLDSVSGVALAGSLENRLDVTLSETLTWEYPNIAALAEYLATLVGDPTARRTPQEG